MKDLLYERRMTLTELAERVEVDAEVVVRHGARGARVVTRAAHLREGRARAWGAGSGSGLHTMQDRTLH